MSPYAYNPAEALPARLKRRLDCPTAGPVVFLIAPTGEGYAKVKSTAGLHCVFETLIERLHPY